MEKPAKGFRRIAPKTNDFQMNSKLEPRADISATKPPKKMSTRMRTKPPAVERKKQKPRKIKKEPQPQNVPQLQEEEKKSCSTYSITHNVYNRSWERLPHFQGWLTAHMQVYHAICKVCNRVLRAHRNDLSRHSKARTHRWNMFKSNMKVYEESGEEVIMNCDDLFELQSKDMELDEQESNRVSEKPKRKVEQSDCLSPDKIKVEEPDDEFLAGKVENVNTELGHFTIIHSPEMAPPEQSSQSIVELREMSNKEDKVDIPQRAIQIRISNNTRNLDEAGIFGEIVATEMRNISDERVRAKFKQKIFQFLYEASEE